VSRKSLSPVTKKQYHLDLGNSPDFTVLYESGPSILTLADAMALFFYFELTQSFSKLESDGKSSIYF